MNLDQPVTSIMTTHVITVSPTQKLSDVKNVFEKNNFHHHIPVSENGKLTGMICLSDYMNKARGAFIDEKEEIYSRLTVADIMRTDPYCRSSNTSIREIASELEKGDIQAIVIADDKVIKGIVSAADLIRFLFKQ